MSTYHKLRSLYQLLLHILLAKSLQLLGLPQNSRDKKMYSAWEFFLVKNQSKYYYHLTISNFNCELIL